MNKMTYPRITEMVSGFVKGVTAGIATITCTAADGSGVSKLRMSMKLQE